MNASVPVGAAFPTSPNAGEMFYLSAISGANQPGFYVYGTNSLWASILVQGSAPPGQHSGDSSVHITPEQNTLLNGLAPTLTSEELNFVDGVTSSIQSQFSTTNLAISTHTGDPNVHVSATQFAFLSGLSPTLTPAKLNFVDDVTSPIQAQLADIVDDASARIIAEDAADVIRDARIDALSGDTTATSHITNQDLHLTEVQNAFLDGISVSGISVQDITSLQGAGLDSTPLAERITNLSANKLNRDGSQAMTGDLSMGGFTVTGLAYPAELSDAATKEYVDDRVLGMQWFEPARVASTSNIDLSAGGLLTVDGIVLSISDRVLVKNQTDETQNGIYLAATEAWSRAPEYSDASAIAVSALYIEEGTLNAKTSWVQTKPITAVGTDVIAFSPLAAPASFNTAGDGLELSVSGTVSLKDGAGVTFDGLGNVAIALEPSGGLMVTTNNITEALITEVTAKLALSNTSVVPGIYNDTVTSLTPFAIDAKGRILSTGAEVIITPAFASLTDLPSTLAEHGITDALALTGGTLSGDLSFTSGTLISGEAPVAGSAYFSTGAYGVLQGDNKTSFGFLSGTEYVNYIRGTTTFVNGDLKGDQVFDSNERVLTKAVGVNQTWQDMTASRAVGTPVTNATASPIFVSVTVDLLVGDTSNLVTDTVVIGSFAEGTGSGRRTLTGIVLPGSSYEITGTGTIYKFFELR